MPAMHSPDPFRLCELVGDDELQNCGLQDRRVALAKTGCLGQYHRCARLSYLRVLLDEMQPCRKMMLPLPL